jgi:Cof subfamily protein (haloacid dehalogenase superfamily)
MAKNKDNIKMVLLDLDGTLLNNDKKIGHSDLEVLEELGKQGVKRIFATGRTFYSCLQVLKNDHPFDYLVFSSGAGVYDWKNQRLLSSLTIEQKKVLEIEKELIKLDLNFSIHFPIPDNHKYYYFRANGEATDFDWRNSIYKDHSFELSNGYPLDFATQFLVILKDASNFEHIASKFPEMKVIRATSPIDGKSVWLEIFNPHVSKAKGGDFICKKLDIQRENTLSIGNDYNDLDLLNWTKFSYVVNNSPQVLLEKFKQCTDNQNNPLSFVYAKHWH